MIAFPVAGAIRPAAALRVAGKLGYQVREHQSMKTPRTDRVATDGWSGDAIAVPYEFAQKLEIENRRLKAEIRKLKPKTTKKPRAR